MNFNIKILLFSIFIFFVLLIVLKYTVSFVAIHQEFVSKIANSDFKNSLGGSKKTPKTLRALGYVSIAAENIHQITYQSEIAIENVFVNKGDYVSKGVPLIQFSSTQSTVLAIESAEMAYNFSLQEVERISNLLKQYLSTNTELLTAKENLLKSKSILNNLKKQQVNASQNTIQSPCSCIIHSLQIQPGQIILPNTPILSYILNSELIIRLNIEEQYLKFIKKDLKVTFHFIHNSEKIFDGYIKKWSHIVDPQSGLVDLIVGLNQPPSLLGSKVDATIYLTS